MRMAYNWSAFSTRLHGVRAVIFFGSWLDGPIEPIKPMHELSACRGDLNNTQSAQQTDIRSSCAIRSRNPG